MKAGTGLQEDAGTLSVNQSEVPVLPTCESGQVVGKGSNGWECFTPAQSPMLAGGDGIAIDGGTISFEPSTVPATDVWPGTIPYSQVTGAPAPYTDAQAAAIAQSAVTWSTVAPSVPSTAVWPGVVSFNNLGGTAPPGALLSSDGSGWQAATLSSLGLMTTQPLTLYVRTDGSDTACNGSADQPASAAPNCAVASPQQAMNLVPLTIQHAVTINIAAGTYQALAGQTAVLNIRRTILPDTGSLSIVGNGTVTFSGAGSVARGIFVAGGVTPASGSGLTIQNVTVSSTTGDGIAVDSGFVGLSNITVQGAGGSGILCHRHAQCALSNTVTVTGCGSSGVSVTHGATLTNTGTLTSTSNGGDGVDVWTDGTLNSAGSVTATGNTYSGMQIQFGSRVFLSGLGTFSASGGDAISLESSSMLDASGGLTVNVSGNYNGIDAVRGSTITVGGAGAVSITCGSAPTGIGLWENAVWDSTSLTGSFTVSHCLNQAFSIAGNSVFNDAGAGPRSWVANASGALVQTNSTYGHGGFPTGSTSCVTGAQCP